MNKMKCSVDAVWSWEERWRVGSLLEGDGRNLGAVEGSESRDEKMGVQTNIQGHTVFYT